jgi:CheY-like chemotaxis protein
MAIRRNVDAEARLIDDLLDAARVTQKMLKVERRPLSLHELIGAVTRDWDPLQDGGRLDVRLELHAVHDVVEGDADRLSQVLRNLLVNAAKFTPDGGSIVVETQDAEGCVRLSVTDTGRGMTAEELGRAFEPFQSGRPTLAGRAGLGLGLAISRGIVEAHQGQIRVESPGPEQGTRIEIELPSSPLSVDSATEAEPVASRAVEPPAPAPPASPSDANEDAPDERLGVRVLVVDDHEDSAETLALVLEMKGYDVKVAHSVHEAEERAGECDVLISDISLPDGSGLELVKTLQRRRSLPAIALSGYGTEQDRQRSLKAGFAEHLTKPVYPARLIEAVRRVSAPQQP